MYALAYTGANVAKELLSVVEEWRIQDKVVCLTINNGCNIVLAVKLGWKWLPCFEHTLQIDV